MIVVDSSVWIDFLNGLDTRQTDRLDVSLRRDNVLVADLVLAEILQGIGTDRQFEKALRIYSILPQLRICDAEIAVEAAGNFRRLRACGVTIRGTIDTLIATRCIVDGHPLLFSDRDFEPFVTHLGLVDAMTLTS